MPVFKKNNQVKYLSAQRRAWRYSIFFYLALGLWAVTSCKSPSGKPSVSNYNKILDSAKELYDSGKQLQALDYLNSSTLQYKNLDILQQFEYYAIHYNYLFHIKKQNKAAMEYADSIVNLFNTPEKKMKYPAKYGQAFFYKGDVLFAENKFNEAYQYYYQGKLIVNKSLSHCTVADYSYRMGMIMYQQEHFKLAAQNFKNATKEVASCDLSFNYFYRKQELLDNTGLCFAKLNLADSALFYYENALALINKESPRFKERQNLLDVARAVVYGNEANIYTKRSEFHVAKGLLKKSIEVNLRKGNDNRDAELSELKLAHLYYETNETDSLIKILTVVRPQLDTIKNIDAEADWNLLMSDYFTKRKNPQAALQYYIKYDALKDSITRKDQALKQADITQQIKRLEIDSEFDDLKKDSQVQDFYLKIASVFGLMLLLIIFLIFFTWQKSRKNIRELGDLNQQIASKNHDLEQALHEVKVSSQEKDRILRTVAHDLRNPIGGIVSLSHAMEYDEYTEDQREWITLIKETSKNSIALINEILEATNNGTAKLIKEPVEINALVSHSVELLRFKAAEKNQEIKLRLIEKPKELLINREKIWRVISNLISNAIKFSPAGSEIAIKVVDFYNEVEVSVHDNGIGIPENIKDKVFNMFTEAKRSGTAGEKSFGLGLSISQQIIESHGGKIWFESEANKGTTFYFRLPAGS